MSQAPVFVKIDEFKELTKILKTIDAKLSEVEKSVAEVKSLREREAEQIAEWDVSIGDIKSKLGSINNELFQ